MEARREAPRRPLRPVPPSPWAAWCSTGALASAAWCRAGTRRAPRRSRGWRRCWCVAVAYARRPRQLLPCAAGSRSGSQQSLVPCRCSNQYPVPHRRSTQSPVPASRRLRAESRPALLRALGAMPPRGAGGPDVGRRAPTVLQPPGGRAGPAAQPHVRRPGARRRDRVQGRVGDSTASSHAAPRCARGGQGPRSSQPGRKGWLAPHAFWVGGLWAGVWHGSTVPVKGA